MDNFSLEPLNESMSENLIDRSLMPGQLPAIYSQRLLEELGDQTTSDGNTPSEESAQSFEHDEDIGNNELVLVSEELTNLAEMHSFLKKIETKEIAIENEFDNEIVIQLVDYIKSLQKDVENYSQRYYNLEIDKTELETQFYELRIELSQLESENNIHKDIVNEQQEDIDHKLELIAHTKSVELGQIQHSINTEVKALERIESEIEIKSKILDELNEEYRQTPNKKSVPAPKGVTFAGLDSEGEEVNLNDDEDNLARTLEKTNELLNAKLLEKEAIIQEQEFTINRQISMISELSGDLKEYESIAKQLNEQLGNETNYNNDLRHELELKEKMIRKRGLDRQDSLSRITIKIGGTHTNKASCVASPRSIASNDQSVYQATNSFRWESMVTPRAKMTHHTGLSPTSTVRSGYHTLRNFPGADMNELNDYLDELEKLRAENLNLSRKLVDLSVSKQKLLKENKGLKGDIKELENQLDTIKKEFIETDKKISDLNRQLKDLLAEHTALKNKKSERNERNDNRSRRSMRNVMEDANEAQLGGGSCVLFGSKFW